MYTKNVKRKNLICTEYNLTDCKKNLLCRQNKSTWYKKYNKPAKYEMYFKLNLISIQSVLNTKYQLRYNKRCTKCSFKSKTKPVEVQSVLPVTK